MTKIINGLTLTKEKAQEDMQWQILHKSHSIGDKDALGKYCIKNYITKDLGREGLQI